MALPEPTKTMAERAPLRRVRAAVWLTSPFQLARFRLPGSQVQSALMRMVGIGRDGTGGPVAGGGREAVARPAEEDCGVVGGEEGLDLGLRDDHVARDDAEGVVVERVGGEAGQVRGEDRAFDGRGAEGPAVGEIDRVGAGRVGEDHRAGAFADLAERGGERRGRGRDIVSRRGGEGVDGGGVGEREAGVRFVDSLDREELLEVCLGNRLAVVAELAVREIGVIDVGGRDGHREGRGRSGGDVDVDAGVLVVAVEARGRADEAAGDERHDAVRALGRVEGAGDDGPVDRQAVVRMELARRRDGAALV